ncbi:serine/threonine-protein kinase [Fischerella thermalis]|uniref:serine/threonine-protein kinase n=1 Tax=Fischerella thermalis TaxID=372787 RepID=UPI000C80E626|nr:serine/threonine-protein kinase [Fischerella thermalis]MBF1991793.1 serine/threonine protein kinase [Fischerella thermalis M58_A2018_009]MBF2061957.1 serine/threonine protein kinase [Fischerella thermalis M66_A2018_004]MBF2070221.1 serine/threonine protein kinase [Fischerella thermalis M48_A2018_028]PLZ88621.1 serine/threonine protein kinase [Fischerella thermalis CCMEE 5194]
MLSQLLGERYQVVQVLSQGIFCQTYIAQDIYSSDCPTCVVKHFLPSNKCPIPVEIRRRLFIRETEALKKLGNYNLVPNLLTHFEDNLEFYLVQEFIDGHPLSVELPLGKRWLEREVFQLLVEVLEILNFVHSHGLIHRDVKPSNILRRKQDHRLVLIDFGAVKPIWNQLVRDFISPEQNTTIAIGTPGYMPHEQERGKPRPNSDIYALGMIAIQALTGVHPTQLPEDRHTGEIIWQHLTQVSAELASVLNKMVHYHFKDRYQSAQEALLALLPLASLYASTRGEIFDSTSIFTFAPQTLPPEADTHLLSGENKISPLLLDDQTSKFTIPETLLSPTNFYQTTQNDEGLQIQNPSFRQSDNQDFENDSQPRNTTITIFLKRPALLIGLVLGAISGVILMVVSYWSVQIVSPTPKVQDLQLHKHVSP